MRKITITKEVIGTITKKGCSIAFTGLAMLLPYVTERNVATIKYYIGKANYSDAVTIIMKSDMLSSYKNEVMEMLKKNEDAEYYRAVIQVVNSDMLGSRKVDAIRMINEK